MKKVIRIDEWTTIEGKIAEVEITFEGNSKAKYTGIESRQGSKRIKVKEINEWTDAEGNIQILEIIFEDETILEYKGEKIERKGNL